MQINSKKFIKEVAKDCDYYSYEVEDIINSFVRILQKKLIHGETVDLLLFKVEPYIKKAYPIVSVADGQSKMVPEKRHLTYKTSPYMKGKLNEFSKG